MTCHPDTVKELMAAVDAQVAAFPRSYRLNRLRKALSKAGLLPYIKAHRRLQTWLDRLLKKNYPLFCLIGRPMTLQWSPWRSFLTS